MFSTSTVFFFKWKLLSAVFYTAKHNLMLGENRNLMPKLKVHIIQEHNILLGTIWMISAKQSASFSKPFWLNSLCQVACFESRMLNNCKQHIKKRKTNQSDPRRTIKQFNCLMTWDNDDNKALQINFSFKRPA